MRAIILEDESILRQALKNKIRMSGLPVEIIGEGTNGMEGLELVRRLRPDIVVTDIRMPGMDGLQFIERALRDGFELNFIIVSGYGDFDYAKRAIQFGVSDFLLKPVSEKELSDALERLIRAIEEEHRFKAERERLISSQQKNEETLRQQYLTKLVQMTGKTRAEEAAAHDKQLAHIRKYYGRYMVVVVELEPYRLPHRSFQEGDEAIIEFAVENIMLERMAAAGQEGLLFQHAIERGESVYVLGLTEGCRGSVARKWLDEVLYGIREYLKLQATIAIGTVVTRFEDIQLSYAKAKHSLRNKMIHGPGMIFEYETIHRQSLGVSAVFSKQDETTWFEWLDAGDEANCMAWIAERFRSVAEQPDATYSHMEWLCVELFSSFRKYLGETPMAEWLIGEMDDLMLWLQTLTTWQDAVSEMKRLTGNVLAYLSKQRPMDEKDVMDRVKHFIDHHYREPITLKTISEQFYIHPNYFSKRFKERFGHNFLEYLTALRMDAAGKMICETELKVSQIADILGFEDASYFGNVFRKHFGQTPTQYRTVRRLST